MCTTLPGFVCSVWCWSVMAVLWFCNITWAACKYKPLQSLGSCICVHATADEDSEGIWTSVCMFLDMRAIHLLVVIQVARTHCLGLVLPSLLAFPGKDCFQLRVQRQSSYLVWVSFAKHCMYVGVWHPLQFLASTARPLLKTTTLLAAEPSYGYSCGCL